MNQQLKNILIGVVIAVAAHLALAPVVGHIHFSVAESRIESAITEFFSGAVSEPLEDLIEVPDVTGLSKSDAERVLDEYGLEMGEPRIMSDGPGSRVISQRPEPGHLVRPARRVTVSIGEEMMGD